MIRSDCSRATRTARRDPERGFTILEVTVALFITAEVILAALALFDFHNRLARVQTQVSDMQQSLRIAQYDMVRMIREAGRGGMPAIMHQGLLNQAWGAVSVRNNVGTGGVSNQVAIGFAGTPTAVNSSDILTVRGVLSTPVFQVNNFAHPLTLTGGGAATTPANATAGTVIVCAFTNSDILQDLSALINAVKAGQSEAIIMTSPVSDTLYAVVELNAAASDVTSPTQPGCMASFSGVTPNPNGIKLAFNVTGDTNANAFQALGAVTSAAGLPNLMTSANFLGILEEYRFYVREDYVVPGNTASDWAPHLSRARFYPGTELPYQAVAGNLQVDVADNALDLQVALGVDLNGDGVLTENTPPDKSDEWMGNASGDTLTPQSPLREVRISTLAKTLNPDPVYQAPAITSIEDHTYTALVWPNTQAGKNYRRRLLQTVIGLRNL